jgi:hypothetical protein
MLFEDELVKPTSQKGRENSKENIENKNKSIQLNKTKEIAK